MSFLNKIFSTGVTDKKGSPVPWKQLSELNQLDLISEESGNKPVAIFKHSTRCGISRMALSRFEKNYDYKPEELSFYFLDLLAYRDISNEIAARFKVHHESPQLIVVKNGGAVYHASHSGIDVKDLRRFI